MAYPISYDELCRRYAFMEGRLAGAEIVAKKYIHRSVQAVALLVEWKKWFDETRGYKIRMDLEKLTNAFLSTVDQKGDARSESEDAHDDGEPLEGQTQDCDEASRDQPDP